MTTAPNRRGRKRKSGPRGSTGRLTQPQVDYRALAALWPHRRGLPAIKDHNGKVVRDHSGRVVLGGSTVHAETVAGRMYLRGHLTRAQHDAGERYARIVGRYRAVIDAPSASPRSIAGAGEPAGAFFYMDPTVAAARKKTYDEAFMAVCEAGQKSARMVARVCVYDTPVATHEEADQLRRGLDALARHFGL